MLATVQKLTLFPIWPYISKSTKWALRHPTCVTQEPEQKPQNQNKDREAVDEAEADAEAAARAFKNMPDELKELVASNMDKVPKNGQVNRGFKVNTPYICMY